MNVKVRRMRGATRLAHAVNIQGYRTEFEELAYPFPRGDVVCVHPEATVKLYNKSSAKFLPCFLANAGIRPVGFSVPSKLTAHAVELVWRRLCSIVVKAGMFGEQEVDLIRHADGAPGNSR
jgi:hypothetical protein